MTRTIRSLSTLCFCLFCFFRVDAQQPVASAPQKEKQASSEPAAAIPANEAAEMLEKLKLEGKFYVRAAGDTLTLPQDLTAKDFFGWKFSNGNRIAGESSGTYYGYAVYSYVEVVGGSRLTDLIGFFYSDAKFSLDAQSFDEGPYALFAATDVLSICNGKCADFPLRSKIDAALLAEPTRAQGSPKRPKVSLMQEGKNVFMNLEGNKFLISLK